MKKLLIVNLILILITFVFTLLFFLDLNSIVILSTSQGLTHVSSNLYSIVLYDREIFIARYYGFVFLLLLFTLNLIAFIKGYTQK